MASSSQESTCITLWSLRLVGLMEFVESSLPCFTQMTQDLTTSLTQVSVTYSILLRQLYAELAK